MTVHSPSLNLKAQAQESSLCSSGNLEEGSKWGRDNPLPTTLAA